MEKSMNVPTAVVGESGACGGNGGFNGGAREVSSGVAIVSEKKKGHDIELTSPPLDRHHGAWPA
jgi:hypothetical protein